MHLRKALTLCAAVAAAGALAIAPAAQATTPTGGTLQYIKINNVSTNGTVATSGTFKGGTATFVALGYTATCSAGSVVGTVKRGAITSGTAAFNFTTLSITCNTPLGISATIALAPGCSVNVNMGGVRTSPNDNVHDSYNPTATIDSGLYNSAAPQKVHNVLGTLVLPAPALNCVTVTLSSGTCKAYVQGNANVEFDEAKKTVAGTVYQDLILRGTGLSLYGQTASCLGLMSGAVTLNNIDFNIPAEIDFRVNP
ncbi:hypothetical protein GCM10023350_50240 [Nocardioides endophyticus]|uniref:Tat pathway signal sequence domain protein n=1 Tax=Nocardioides endophyticus TaxID=1353775 RepID=A0ABP8ZKC7_9ACTN